MQDIEVSYIDDFMWPFKHKARELPGQPNKDAFQRVLSVLSPADVQELGELPCEAIAGTIEAGSQSPDAVHTATENSMLLSQFRPNPAFSTFLHQIVGTYGPQDRELQRAAEQQGNGFVYIIDLRTPEGVMGRVPPEDIVGAFAVKGGKLGTYQPNDKHLAFSKNGLVQLPPSLAEIHIRELKRLKGM